MVFGGFGVNLWDNTLSMDITGVVIAGGKSKRMGFDKAGIKIGDVTFLQSAVNLLHNFFDDVLISSNTSGDDNPITVKDIIQDIGPMGGIYTCLQEVSSQKILVVPVDLPLLDKKLISYLLTSANWHKQATVFEVKGRLQPLVGLYDVSLLPLMRNQINKKDYKLHHLLQMSSCQIVNGDIFADKFVNINTQEELVRLKKGL